MVWVKVWEKEGETWGKIKIEKVRESDREWEKFSRKDFGVRIGNEMIPKVL